MKENKIAGVYKISNKVTGDFYIGSSKNIKKRWVGHKSPSTWKAYPNLKLYQAFIKYGLDNFMFEVIENTTDLHVREQYYIEQLKPSYNDKRANGIDTERHKESNKEWRQAHQEEHLAKNKIYYNRLCLYEGEPLTLSALSNRFRRQGISNSVTEAKKYLI